MFRCIWRAPYKIHGWISRILRLLLKSGSNVMPTCKCKIPPTLEGVWIRTLPTHTPGHLAMFSFIILFTWVLQLSASWWVWEYKVRQWSLELMELSGSRNFLAQGTLCWMIGAHKGPPNKHSSYLGMMQAEAFPKAAESCSSSRQPWWSVRYTSLKKANTSLSKAISWRNQQQK